METPRPPTPTTPPAGPPAQPPPRRRTGHAIAAGTGVLAAASLVTVVVVAPAGLRASADPGAPVVPHWALMMPAVVGLLAVRLLPWRVPVLQPVLEDRAGALRALAVMGACALALPVLVGVLDLGGSAAYHPVKVLVLVVVPGVVVRWTRGSVSVPRPVARWQWWAPALAVTAWALPTVVAPWNEVPDYADLPVELVVGAAVLTALTAGVGEELFYRYWLQTRAEAVLGRWGGVAVATLLFALLHVGSRQGLGLGVEVAAALVVQGSFGLFVAYLWARHRNLWMAVAAHVLVNGYPVVVAMLRG